MPREKRKIFRQIAAVATSVLSVYLLDRVTKALAEGYLDPSETIPVIKGLFHVTLVYNTGAAFGILRSYPEVFVPVAAAALCVITGILIFKNDNLNRLEITALSFMLAGVMGNLTDRVLYGHVIDFIDLRVWPVFNIADSFITTGVGMLIISTIFTPGRKRPGV